jgi:GTP-binding protein HflX
VLISDTVGFIRKLPHQLVSAFRATLEEVVEADLILHVIDVSDPDREEKKSVVLDVLREIGAGDHPMLTVYNKADLLEGTAGAVYDRSGALTECAHNGQIAEQQLLVSAVTGEGLDRLVAEIVHIVSPVRV